MCLSVCLHICMYGSYMYLVPVEARIRVTDDCELLRGCWEPKPGQFSATAASALNHSVIIYTETFFYNAMLPVIYHCLYELRNNFKCSEHLISNVTNISRQNH